MFMMWYINRPGSITRSSRFLHTSLFYQHFVIVLLIAVFWTGYFYRNALLFLREASVGETICKPNSTDLQIVNRRTNSLTAGMALARITGRLCWLLGVRGASLWWHIERVYAQADSSLQQQQYFE